MILPRRLLRQLDFGLVACVLTLVCMGLVMVYSATRANAVTTYGDPYSYVKRQAIAAVIGAVVMVMILATDYKYLERLSLPIYVGGLVLLCVVLVLGRRVSGSLSWIRVGSRGVQPSEIAKICLIVFLAALISRKDDMATARGLIAPFAYAGVPVVLILLQNDLGTALVYGAILLGMLYVGGAQPRHLLAVLGAAAVASPVVFLFLLKPYQRGRFLAFLNPYRDATGQGYNVIQSTIAVGSGRLFGKGLLGGSQAQLNFLPAHHTDFIFSVVGEELGFIGAVFLLALYFYVIWSGIRTAGSAKDRFGALLAAGFTSMFLFHLLVNVGMAMSLMPVTGIPLPFLSFGGSSLVANMAGIAIVMNVYMRRHKILF